MSKTLWNVGVEAQKSCAISICMRNPRSDIRDKKYEIALVAEVMTYVHYFARKDAPERAPLSGGCSH